MKSKNPQILLLGNNSGNNLGDAAIMSSILHNIGEVMPDSEFYVPSVKASFINDNYSSKYKVKGIDVMPWTGSVRLFGIPTLYYMYKSDVALICDGIIFGKKLFNPLFNFLITLIFLVPFAKLFNCKLVCFCCGIGPFPSKFSEKCAKYVMNACSLITLREQDSVELAKKIGVNKEIKLTGDIALVNPTESKERGAEILKENGIDPKEKILGVNITRYIDGWLYSDKLKVQDKEYLVKSIADAVKITCKEVSAKPLVFSTQPMDDNISNKLAKLLNTAVIGNSRYLSHDIQAAMSYCSLFTGMRLHSLYLASAVENPIVAMIYAPKVRSYMKQIGSSKYGIELTDITPESFSKVLLSAWAEKDALKEKQQIVVRDLKQQVLITTNNLKEVIVT